MSSGDRLQWSQTIAINPSAGGTLQAIRPAIPGVVHVCTHIGLHAFQNSASAYGNFWQLYDGTTIIMEGILSVPGTIGYADHVTMDDLNLPGTSGNSMTLQWLYSATTACGLILVGYDL